MRYETPSTASSVDCLAGCLGYSPRNIAPSQAGLTSLTFVRRPSALARSQQRSTMAVVGQVFIPSQRPPFSCSRTSAVPSVFQVTFFASCLLCLDSSTKSHPRRLPLPHSEHLPCPRHLNKQSISMPAYGVSVVVAQSGTRSSRPSTYSSPYAQSIVSMDSSASSRSSVDSQYRSASSC